MIALLTLFFCEFLVFNLIGVYVMMKLSKKLVVFGVTSSLSVPLLAGSLDSPAAPSDANSRMYTLEDIWNRLDGTEASALSGVFKEPIAGPTVGTGKTLTEVYNKADIVMDAIPSCTPNPSANPVFTDNTDGTVTDNRTCLMWLKDTDCVGKKAWADVDTSAKVVALINGKHCDDYTNDTHTDWRLPTVQELQSLVHYGYSSPAMSNAAGTEKWGTGTTGDDAFSGVRAFNYWSSTTYANNTGTAWYVYLVNGAVDFGFKSGSNYIWPVRGRQ
jgi:hypothetical protein